MVSESPISVPSIFSSRWLPRWGYWNANMSTSLPSFRVKSQFLILDHQILGLFYSLIFLCDTFTRSDIMNLPNAMCSKAPNLCTSFPVLLSPHTSPSKIQLICHFSSKSFFSHQSQTTKTVTSSHSKLSRSFPCSHLVSIPIRWQSLSFCNYHCLFVSPLSDEYLKGRDFFFLFGLVPGIFSET